MVHKRKNVEKLICKTCNETVIAIYDKRNKEELVLKEISEMPCEKCAVDLPENERKKMASDLFR